MAESARLIIRLALGFSTVVWIAAILCQVFNKKKAGMALLVAGWLSVVGLLVFLWITLGRPPLRTMGETRIWFAASLPLIALIMNWRFSHRGVNILVLTLACIMCLKDLLSPGAFDQTMMPALRSGWFIPHVVSYMFSYSTLALSSALAIWFLIKNHINKNEEPDPSQAEIMFTLIQIGFPLMTFGLLSGAIWAKEAWSDYWSWDPKETWALISWLLYAGYIHLYWRKPDALKPQLILLIIAGIALMITWFGVNLLPSSSQSIHTYSG